MAKPSSNPRHLPSQKRNSAQWRSSLNRRYGAVTGFQLEKLLDTNPKKRFGSLFFLTEHPKIARKVSRSILPAIAGIALKDPQFSNRALAIELLGRIGGKHACSVFIQILRKNDLALINAVLRYIWFGAYPELAPDLLRIVEQNQDIAKTDTLEVARNSAFALANVKAGRAMVNPIIQAMRKENMRDPQIIHSVLAALMDIGSREPASRKAIIDFASELKEKLVHRALRNPGSLDYFSGMSLDLARKIIASFSRI